MTCSNQAYRVAIGTFQGILQKILSRKALIAARRVRGLRVKGTTAVITMTTPLAMLLIGCVEPHPGPGQSNDSTSDRANSETTTTTVTASESNNDNDNFRQLHVALANVTAAIGRLETGQTSLSTAQGSFSSELTHVRSKLDRKLNEIEEKQAQQDSRMDSFSAVRESLQEENSNLRSSEGRLEEELDSGTASSSLVSREEGMNPG